MAAACDNQSFGTGYIYTSQTTPMLCINFTPINGSLKLCWTVPSANFVLQQSSHLTTANWSNVTNVPVLNFTNLQDEVTVRAGNGAGYFRLKTP